MVYEAVMIFIGVVGLVFLFGIFNSLGRVIRLLEQVIREQGALGQETINVLKSMRRVL